MKNNKRFAILLLAAALATTSLAACGNGNDEDESSASSDSSAVEAVTRQSITFYYGEDSDDESGDSSDDALDEADPTESGDSSSADSGDSSEDATEYISVTESDGTPATTYVEVTDENGETVTDSNGEPETESVQVTTSIKSTSSGSDESDSDSDSDSEYTANLDEAWAMWLDISKDDEYVFNDAFIEVTFKIKDTTPDGVYDVTITDPDFANLDNGGSTVVPDTVLDGKVYVSQTLEEQREVTDDDGFAVYADNVAAKQGDEVTVTFSFKNNPGLVAMMFKFQYDKNAMSIVECNAVGEFYEIASPSFSDIEEETSAEE